MVHRYPGSGCRAQAWERTALAPRVGNHTGLPCTASLPVVALTQCLWVQTRAERVGGWVAGFWSRGRARPPESPGRIVPTPTPPRPRGPVPAARAPGPPLMPAMAVTSLLAPRPGRWPGDPRRAAAARQHPEVHDAALPPAARAGAWRARGAGSGPVRGRPSSFAAAGPAGACGAGLWFPGSSACPKSPPALGKGARGARGDAGDGFAGSLRGLTSRAARPAHSSSHQPVCDTGNGWSLLLSSGSYPHRDSGEALLPTSPPFVVHGANKDASSWEALFGDKRDGGGEAPQRSNIFM